MKKKWLVTISIIAVIVVVVLFLQNRNEPIDVEGYKVSKTTYKEVISSIGAVEYDKEVEIKAEVSGKVSTINGKVGETIKSGAVVAKIDDRQARVEFEEIQKSKDVATARLADYNETYAEKQQSVNDQRTLQKNEIALLKLEEAQLKTKIADTKSLLEDGLVPEKDLTDLNDQLAALQLRIANANKKLESLRSPTMVDQELQESIGASDAKMKKQQILLEKYTIYSNLDGIIVDRLVEPGAFVQAGEVIMKVTSNSRKYAVVDIDEKYLQYVKVGKSAQIFAEAYPNEMVKGTVESISPEVDKESGTVEIKVKIDEKVDLFLRNMSVKVEFVSKSYDDAIVIPGSYLINDKTTAVYMKGKDGQAVKKAISVSNKNAENVMVLKGLSEGTIILNPENVKDGKTVNVKLLKESEKGL